MTDKSFIADRTQLQQALEELLHPDFDPDWLQV